ncbi:MAG TPA: TonB-dependent receptor [Pseudomonadales bacterium]|nr:TonB-dependent receptor [Pseudomonadales bacterium]
MRQITRFARTAECATAAGTLRRLLAACAATLLLLAGSPATAIETVGAIRGAVVSPGGDPVGGATISATDTRTGRVKSGTTDAGGSFFLSNLEVGGPYRIVIDSSRYPLRTVDDVFVSLGQTYNLSVQLGGAIEELVVTAEAISSAAVAVGPSTNFSLADLESAPAINRDLKDLIRLDPRVYIDEAFEDSIQCNGANPRFNSLTVDGVRLNDLFGLNSNGYPTERQPFSYDAIQNVAVELAPFDVQYGGFSACNINAVTKSGSNEFALSAFYDYTQDSWSGDSLEGDSIELGDFDEKRYGVSGGGPIIEDRLFFFAAYEKLEGVNIFDRGPVGSSAGRPIAGLSQADFDEILDIARNVYGYEPGRAVSSLPVDDEKLLLKLTANITDQHRAAFTYNYNDGYNNAESDGDDNEFEFSNHFYERGAELNSYVGQLFSDWTDNFSTELRIGYVDLENRQIPLGGTDFGEVQIDTQNDPDGDGNFSRATVYLGADDSRHANQLSYENWSYKFNATYSWNNHYITAGIERDELEVFNLFIQEAEGEYRFSSIDDFRNGTPNRITYENAAPSNIPADAAARFEYEINALYLQDEIFFSELDLTVVAGVRYEWYTSGDEPNANPNFQARYGFSNTANLDDKDLFQPRVAFQWGVNEALRVRGGVGIFSGGNPNVWISNNYSNDGITQVEVQDRSLDDGTGDTLFTIPFDGGGRPIFDIPQDLFDAVASGTADSGTNSLDPGFDIPYSVKYNLGASYLFDAPFGLGTDYLLDADILYSQFSDSAIIRDLTLERTGTAADGRPIYRGIDRSDADCADPTAAACSGRREDYQLTNVDGNDAEQLVLSMSLAKSYDNGLSWALGYAYTESDDVNPMTSSVAFSNYHNIAVSDAQNPGAATSNYEIPHRFTMRLQYERAFFGDNYTRLTLFGSVNEGRAFSYVFAGAGDPFGDLGFTNRQLLYVPTGPNDPIVSFGPDFDQDAFFAFAREQGLGGGIQDRNEHNGSWWAKFDVKVEQEFSLPMRGQAKAFLIVENLGNLLNDDWGVLKEASFPRAVQVVDADYDAAAGQYSFNEFLDPTIQGRNTDASLWEIRAGIRVDF